MAVKDIASNLKQTVALQAAIASNTDTDGAILDTADYELGLMFALHVSAYTDGTYAFQVFESDDQAMSGATQVTGERLIGSIADATAVVAQGATLDKLGVFSNKRYVRVRIVSTGVTTGATITVVATEKAEIGPTA